MHLRLIAFCLVGRAIVFPVAAQTFDAGQALDTAKKHTLPTAVWQIEHNNDVKLAMEVDAASFGADEKAWGNLNIITNRIVGAMDDVGRDQAGKDALERDVKRVVIVKLPTGQEDGVQLKQQTLYVRTTASDKAMIVLQNRIIAGLEDVLHTGHPPPTP